MSGTLYKSYIGKKRKHSNSIVHNWSQPMKIERRKKVGNSYRYYIDGMWRDHNEIQAVSKVYQPKKAQRKKAVPKKKPMKLRSVKKVGQPVLRMRLRSGNVKS